MNETPKRNPTNWRTSVILWASGILTGVSYCSAVTVAHADAEGGAMMFGISAGFFAMGCVTGIFLITKRSSRTRGIEQETFKLSSEGKVPPERPCGEQAPSNW